MPGKPRTVKVGDSIVDAAKLMRGEETGIAPIVDGWTAWSASSPTATSRSASSPTGRDPQADEGRRDRLVDLVTVDPDLGLEEALDADGASTT